MKRIIVATDFSAESLNALAYTAQAVKGRQYEIVLFTLQNPSIHVLNARVPPKAFDSYLAQRHQKLTELAEKTRKEHQVSISTYFASGEFYEEVNKCIDESDAFMLVMGMASKSLEQDMTGNTTTAAINRIKVPVLSIPLGAKYSGIKHILFACDVVRGVHQTVLEKIREFAHDFEAMVEVFNVSKKVEEIADNNADSIDKGLEGIEYYYRNVASNEIVEAIREGIQSSKTDLLIMVPYKYGFWNSLVHRSKTRMMASGNSVPLLTISL